MNIRLNFNNKEPLIQMFTKIYVADAMNLHHVEPKHYLLIKTDLKGIKGFVETKSLSKIDFLSSFDK